MKGQRSVNTGHEINNSRLALIAVVLFLLFDFTALALNIWLSQQIEQQAVAINLAGRQRMLSQRTVKVLLQLQNAKAKGDALEVYLNELRISFDLFDSTLQGFGSGGNTLGGDNRIVLLKAVTGPDARKLVDQALVIWQPYRLQIAEVLLAGNGVSDEALFSALGYAAASNLQLLDLMNRLTSELELETQQEATRIRLYQAAAFVLAMVNFFWVFLVYHRRLEHYSSSHDLLDIILNKISAAVLVVDKTGRILKCNHTVEALFGYREDEIHDKQLSVLLKSNNLEMIGCRKDGTHFPAICERGYAKLDGRKMEIVTVLDVTLQRSAEAHLSKLAYHDILTKLPNRLFFEERLAEEICQAQSKNSRLAVFFVDLDRFKPINDQYGHEAGDKVLQEVAVRLKSCLRDSDIVSRRGGDEFTIITSNIVSYENCEKIAEMILAQMPRPFYFNGQPMVVSCSIGISLYPIDAEDVHGLLVKADAAMYAAKQAGRNAYCFYSKNDWIEGQ